MTRKNAQRAGARSSRRTPPALRLAQAMSDGADRHRARGQLAKAETLYRATLVRRKEILGPEHLDVAKSMNCLASLLNEQGRHAEAEPLYRESLALRKKELG